MTTGDINPYNSIYAEPLALSVLPDTVPRYHMDARMACLAKGPLDRLAAQETLKISLRREGVDTSESKFKAMELVTKCFESGLLVNTDKLKPPLPLLRCDANRAGDVDICQGQFNHKAHSYNYDPFIAGRVP